MKIIFVFTGVVICVIGVIAALSENDNAIYYTAIGLMFSLIGSLIEE